MNTTRILIFCALTVTFCAHATIRLVLTTALAQAHYELRKNQFLTCFKTLEHYDYYPEDIYIIEAIAKEGPTFLDEYSDNVFYSTVNDPSLRNKGINEARTMLEGLKFFDFDPDDMIIKLTGRYKMLSNDFLRLITEYSDQFDAFARVNIWYPGSAGTMFFAMKYKYLKEMFEALNYEQMELLPTDIERELGNYLLRKINEGNFKLCTVDRLNLEVNYFGSVGSSVDTDQIIIY